MPWSPVDHAANALAAHLAHQQTLGQMSAPWDWRAYPQIPADDPNNLPMQQQRQGGLPGPEDPWARFENGLEAAQHSAAGPDWAQFFHSLQGKRVNSGSLATALPNAPFTPSLAQMGR
jgi:hypothetical protein